LFHELQEGMTVLHVAAAQGLASMISVLVLLDADIDANTLVKQWPFPCKNECATLLRL